MLAGYHDHGTITRGHDRARVRAVRVSTAGQRSRPAELDEVMIGYGMVGDRDPAAMTQRCIPSAAGTVVCDGDVSQRGAE